ncbi:phosphoserine phosphatase SerB [Sulfurirhabdus autotrophica]|uniref:Phosphoserine phosphatase n=1 Tax=Sulfurirhabdus autotrophica TaxID=1706046 RepID=A0A4R3YFG8_9PROT|nr:phosphoserine phosphatase SerB [Sulfurirhabdus autotrophica]TCV90721.1 phosphoserine phosphatase [Sulfurirhabdus autotrophica]
MNLIIQGLEVQTQDLKQIAKLCAANGIESINQQAFRLVNTHHTDNIAEIESYCANAKLDYAFVPETRAIDQFGLLVMDMDSTLITIECIDEIADMVGVKPQVAEITEAAMRGEIDFAESLTRRVALLKGLDESALQRVYDERLELSPGAEKMLKKLKDHGIKTLLVSGGFTFFTEKLKSRLGLDYASSNTLEIIDGKLTGNVLGKILDAQGKADALNQLRTELGMTKEQVISMGDGANDLKMMAEAGISIAYRAKPIVRAQASYAISHVGLDGMLNLLNAL